MARSTAPGPPLRGPRRAAGGAGTASETIAAGIFLAEYPATVCRQAARKARPPAPPISRRRACAELREAPMKLIIQIPCFNEEGQLPVTLAALPRKVPGFASVEWLIIDDGSSDATIEVARAHGVDHVVRLTNNKGLAAAFQAGLDAGLKLGADVIVNTDADNQYEGSEIPRLVEPIVRGDADMVVGDRRVMTIEHFSAPKKLLQRLGSWVVRHASSTEVPDTTSGFRAYNREAALQMQVVSKFTYTLETIIQAGKLLVAIDHVPVNTNPKIRESRLFPSTAAYVRRNAISIFRIYTQYEPLRVFWSGAILMGSVAVVLFLRFLVYCVQGDGRGHIQSLIAGAVLFNAAMLLGSLGVIGDLLAAQRTLSQRTFERVRRIELQLGIPPSHYEPGHGPGGEDGASGAEPGADTTEHGRQALEV
jgi:glycosyltransferase involved in cell wall biosynthesis